MICVHVDDAAATDEPAACLEILVEPSGLIAEPEVMAVAAEDRVPERRRRGRRARSVPAAAALQHETVNGPEDEPRVRREHSIAVRSCAAIRVRETDFRLRSKIL